MTLGIRGSLTKREISMDLDQKMKNCSGLAIEKSQSLDKLDGAQIGDTSIDGGG
jgi:hypothetical protein